MGRSIHEELAGGLSEIVKSEPTEAIYNNSRYDGVVMSPPEQSFDTLDGGYQDQIDFDWMVTVDELAGAKPKRREKLTIDGTEYRIVNVTGRPIADPKYYKLGLQQINAK